MPGRSLLFGSREERLFFALYRLAFLRLDTSWILEAEVNTRV